MTLEVRFHRPRSGTEKVDRAVLLAHGAGSDMHSPSLTTVCAALADRGIPSLRFNFPYATAGRKAPDRAPVLEAATREAIAALSERAGVPPERLVLGGRSMGGRYCSMVVGHETEPVDALALALLGYPLHPAGKPEQLRVEHFSRLLVPVLFVSGTRDALGSPEALRREAKAIKGSVTFHWLDTADHGFRPLKASALTREDVFTDVAAAVTQFVSDLPA